MKIDLYKMLDVKEEEEFEINNSDYIYQIINNEIYFRNKYSDWIKSSISLNDIKEVIKIPKEPSDMMCNLIKMLKPKWKYMAMDKDGRVYLYVDKPTKYECSGIWDVNDDVVDDDNFAINDLIQDEFGFLSWEDEEPFDIDMYK